MSTVTIENSWIFDEGIMASKPIPGMPMIRKFYYVRYRKGNLRRLFTVVITFGINQSKDNLLRWASGENTDPFIIDTQPKFLSGFSKVSTIMDFSADEKDQHPKKFEELEKDFDFIDPKNEDEKNSLSLKFFEKYLPLCSYEKCVCTLTNDEESLRRIKEIYPEGIPEQNPSGSEQPAPAP